MPYWRSSHHALLALIAWVWMCWFCCGQTPDPYIWVGRKVRGTFRLDVGVDFLWVFMISVGICFNWCCTLWTPSCVTIPTRAETSALSANISDNHWSKNMLFQMSDVYERSNTHDTMWNKRFTTPVWLLLLTIASGSHEKHQLGTRSRVTVCWYQTQI